MSDDLLERMVHDNLDNALLNDYDVRTWEVEDIVTDLRCFAADLEAESDDAIRPHVISWLTKARNPQ